MLSVCNSAKSALKNSSIHFGITSIPYWSLRKYEGCDPQIWGGQVDCEHVWGKSLPAFKSGQVNQSKWKNNTAIADGNKQESGQFCQKCGAWYGNFGNEPDPFLFVQHVVEIFREIKRVLRDDGSVVLNIGDTYMGSGGDHKSWHKNDAGQIDRNKLYADIGGARGSKPTGILKAKDKALIPQRIAIALQEDGWYVRQTWEWVKTNGLVESVGDRPTVSHEYLILLSKSERYYWDYTASMLPAAEITQERNKHADNFAFKHSGHPSGSQSNGRQAERPDDPMRRYRTTDAWFGSLEEMIAAYEVYLNHLKACRSEGLLIDETGEILGSVSSTNQFSGGHFATFPPALIEPLIASGCPERVCPECGQAWTRNDKVQSNYEQREPAHQPNNTPSKVDSTGWRPPTIEIGDWHPTCQCVRNRHPNKALTGSDWLKLIDETAKEMTPIPGICLDPFVGSGTTGMVCNSLGRRFVGLDLSASYIAKYAAPLVENKLTEAARELVKPKSKKTNVAKEQLKLF